MAYDYHDEEILGKAYDQRLVRRLVTYARPYLRLIVVSVVILVVVAGAELALPYLTRLAIDDYIVATSRLLTPADAPPDVASPFIEKHRSDLVPVDADAGVGEAWFVRSKTLSGYDPREVARVREAGLIGERDYYLAERDVIERRELMREGYVPGEGVVGIPTDMLSQLSEEDLRAVRAEDFDGVGRIALIIIGILLGSFVVRLFQINMMELTSQRVMYDIRMQILSHLQRLSLSFFDKNPVGRLVTRATNDIEVLHEMFTSIVIMLLRDVFILIGVIVLMLRLNWRLALVSFAVLPFMAWATVVFSVKIRDAFREVRMRVAIINATLQESISGMRITQIFRREDESMRRFRKINHDNFLAAMRQIRVFAMFMPLMELASAIAIGLVIWYGGGQVLRTTLSLGTLVAFLSYVQMFFRPIRNLTERYSTMQQAMASSERIFMLLDNDDMIPEPEDPVIPEHAEGRIEFDDVCFAYVDDEYVLKHVSFKVEPGETVAIVGATGAGKTSIISLLERFYDVRSGRILVDGVDIRDMPKDLLRSRLGLVMQDVFIFAGDIKGNIRLGNDDVGDDDLERIACHVHADHFIERLPGGYDEEVRERGSTLSTGQRQLLAFARALAFDPLVLILDEATSNIDTETERLIQDALVRLLEDRTSIVIAHRLSTIQHADRILVMHNGRICEEGTHQELLAERGYYYRLYELQYKG
ncbi:MAG: ATP-binding cassette domain-containing protein [Candidatus Eisenbacteria bacterium]|nr:ATP-binding cassette domain-containing protein [Candidatus Eisenbacteria bacterium]